MINCDQIGIQLRRKWIRDEFGCDVFVQSVIRNDWKKKKKVTPRHFVICATLELDLYEKLLSLVSRGICMCHIFCTSVVTESKCIPH